MPWPRMRRCASLLVLGHVRSTVIGAVSGMVLLTAIVHAGGGPSPGVEVSPMSATQPTGPTYRGAQRAGDDRPPAPGAATATMNANVGAGHDSIILRVVSGLRHILNGDEPSVATGDSRSATPARSRQSTQSDAALRAAEAEVARAWASLRDVRSEQEWMLAHPEVVELSRAEQTLAQADARLARASAEVQRLSRPDRVQLEAAERSIWRAEATLRAAQTLRQVHDFGQNGQDTSDEITQVQAVLQEARARREAALVGPPAGAVASAQQELAEAQAAQRIAADRVLQQRQHVARLPLEQINAATASAITDLANAEARLRSLQVQRTQQIQASYSR